MKNFKNRLVCHGFRYLFKKSFGLEILVDTFLSNLKKGI